MKVFEPTEDTPAPAGNLGWAAGVVWYSDADAPVKSRVPTERETELAMLELPAIRQLKASARRKIEAEVGDVYEMLADQSRQIEALTALLVRLTADTLGGTPLSQATRDTYLARAENVIAALDSGALTLRGDMEGADDMLSRVMGRTDRINRIVADEYLPGRNALLS